MRAIRRVICAGAVALAWAAAAPAQTDYFSRIVVGSTAPSATSPVKFTGLPPKSGETQCAWIGGDGSLATGQCGTVTSVGLSMPSVFVVTGSPVTASGTLTATLASPWTWTAGGVFGTTTGPFTLTSGGDLTLSATGDIVLGPSGLDVLPDQGYTRHLGGAARKFASLHVAELWASAFVAQENLATVGGRVVVTPTTVLEADVSTGATSIQVKHNSLRNGEIILLERNFQVEWLQVTSGPSGSGPYTYSVTRNLDGTGANSWSAGDAVVSTGVVGDGFMDLYSQRGARQVGLAGTIMASRPKFYVSMDSPTPGGTTQVFDAVTGWTATFANGAVRAFTCGVGTGCPGNNAWRNPGPSYSDTAIALSDANVNADRETGDLTVEAVVHWEGSTSGAKAVVSRHWAREWHLQVEQTNTLTFCQGDGTTYQCWFSPVTLTVGTWQHVVVTRDAGTRQICIYLAGALQQCGTYASVTIAQQNGPIGIGRSPTFAGGAFRGYISEFALYTRKLSATEVATHYERLGVNEFGWSSGPTIVGNVRTGTAWNDVSPRWAIGNLNGLYDYTTTTYGAAFGDPSGAWTAVDATRWRLMHGTTELMKAQGGSLTLTGTLAVTSANGLISAGAGRVLLDQTGMRLQISNQDLLEYWPATPNYAVSWTDTSSTGSELGLGVGYTGSGSRRMTLVNQIGVAGQTNELLLTAGRSGLAPLNSMAMTSYIWLTDGPASLDAEIKVNAGGKVAISGNEVWLSFTGGFQDAVKIRTGGNNNTEVYLASRSGRTGTDFGNVFFSDRSTGTNNLPGMFLAVSAAGVYRFLWPDDAGLWRTAAAPPEADGTPPQNTGTVVGDQSSRRADKIIERTWTTEDQDHALRRILLARVYDFRYRDGRYNGERFSGIITDEVPWLGKDQGKALNEVNAVGYLIGAIQALERRVSMLEANKERER